MMWLPKLLSRVEDCQENSVWKANLKTCDKIAQGALNKFFKGNYPIKPGLCEGQDDNPSIS